MDREQMITTLQLLGYRPCAYPFKPGYTVVHEDTVVNLKTFKHHVYMPASWDDLSDKEVRYHFYLVTQ